MRGAEVPRLVGRDGELAAVADGLRRVAAGGSGITLVEGEPGIGKSRLLDEALARAPDGLTIMRAAATAGDHTKPFGLLAAALGLVPVSDDPQRATIGRLIQEERTSLGTAAALGLGPALRMQVIEAVAELVERTADRRPQVLCLEDLQWADSSTLLAVQALARRLADSPVGIVAAFRPPVRGSELERMIPALAREGATHLVLTALEPAVALELATQVVGGPPGTSLSASLARAEGNPFFVVELMRGLAEEGLLESRDTAVEVSPLASLPATLRDAIARSLSALPEGTADALRVAAVLGSAFAARDLALVADLSNLELLSRLQDALRAGVLIEVGSRFCFRHDLVREAIYEMIPVPLRAGLHRQAAQALADAGASPLEVAHHFALGAAPGDGQAVAWLWRAARTAAARAPDLAAELLDRAIATIDPTDPERDALLADAVVSRLWGNRAPEAEALARDLLSRPHDPDLDTYIRLGLIEALLAQGRTTDAHKEGEVVLADSGLPTKIRAQLNAEAAWGRLFAGDLDGAISVAETALDAALRLDADAAVCVALSLLTAAAVLQGRTEDALELARRGIAAAESARDGEARRMAPYDFLAAALMDADRLEDAEEVLRRAIRQSESLGMAWRVAESQLIYVPLRYHAGRWDDALADAEAGLALTPPGGTFGTLWAHAVPALIALHRNDLARAEARVLKAESVLASSGGQGQAEWALLARALYEEAAGRPDGAVAVLDSAWAMFSTVGVVARYPFLGPDLVRLAVAAGAIDRARSVSQHVECAAERMPYPWVGGAALRCRGLVDDDPDVLVEALTVLRSGPRPLDRAVVAEEAGQALGRRGSEAEAIALLEEAAEGYEALGAERYLARVEASLRSLGVKRGRRGARRRPSTGPEALTAMERRVVDLVNEGLTNRQIAERLYVSPRTVETHLSRIYAKLGVSSRAEVLGAVTSPSRTARSR